MAGTKRGSTSNAGTNNKKPKRTNNKKRNNGNLNRAGNVQCQDAWVKRARE
jgi:hypothetical protein